MAVESSGQSRADSLAGDQGRTLNAASERLARHQQRPREDLGLPLVVGAAGAAGVDRVAVEAQRGDEASLGVVGLEHLDVGGVVDAFGGQGGDTATVDDEAHVPV